MPSRLSQFWQELKRRNVVRVATVYAGAAFVILEFVDIIAPSLGLPGWTLNLVLILLLAGFVIAVIVSWIYDIHPEGRVVKTDPVQKGMSDVTTATSNGWKIASYISFVVIVGLIVLNVIPRSGNRRNFEKSIAVLPFINDSPSSENDYIINGYMTAVHNNLCQIKDLRVLTLQTTEHYRNDTKSIPDIARELGVGYLLSARGQLINNRMRLTVQLADAMGENIWSNPYDRQIAVVDDHFELQSNIAQLVAGKLQSTITPEEKQRIEKIPTSNATAFEFYQKGLNELSKNDLLNFFPDALADAEKLFRFALEYDSTMAEAYVGLANVYFLRYYFVHSKNYLDTISVLADKAIALDPNLSEPYTFKGLSYAGRNQHEMAIQALDMALALNPNDWTAYLSKTYVYRSFDLLKTIKNFKAVISRYYGPGLYSFFTLLGGTYYAAGYRELGDSCHLEAYKLNGDTVLYLNAIYQGEWRQGHFDEALEYVKKAYELDSLDATTLNNLGSLYTFTGEIGKSLYYWEKYIDLLESTSQIPFNNMRLIGYAYWKNGDHGKGDYYLDQRADICEQSIKSKDSPAALQWAYFDLSGIYAFRGETDKALEYLRFFNAGEKFWLEDVNRIKFDPLLDNIRDEPEFQQIVHDVEAKYQAEHERVRQWLEQNAML